MAADNFTFNDVENFSQEIRLTSDDSFRYPWIVGANYGKTDIDWFQTIDLTALAIPTSNGAVQSTEAWAVFGQLTIPLSDTFDFIGGLRFTNETRDWTGATFVGTFASLDEALASGAFRLSQLPLPHGDPGRGGPLDFPTSLDEEKVDFSAVLRYRPNEDAMYYLSVSEAFRSGGYSSAVIFSQEALEPYDPETLRSYEIGMKHSLAENRVRFNTSAFFYDFKDFQATFVRATEASARLQNAGDVEIIRSRGLARLVADRAADARCRAQPAWRARSSRPTWCCRRSTAVRTLRSRATRSRMRPASRSMAASVTNGRSAARSQPRSRPTSPMWTSTSSSRTTASTWRRTGISSPMRVCRCCRRTTVDGVGLGQEHRR